MTTLSGVISYPIPAYQNVAIEPQFFQPSRFVISGISLGVTTIVTTTEDMNFVIGQLTRLLIPASYGSFQLNNALGYVISIPASNQVELTIKSTPNVNAFIIGSGVSQAQIIAIGDINQGTTNNNGPNVSNPGIPGAFENISPL